MRKRVLFYMRTTKAQISLCIRHPSHDEAQLYSGMRRMSSPEKKVFLDLLRWLRSNGGELATSWMTVRRTADRTSRPRQLAEWPWSDWSRPALYLHCLPRPLRTNHVVITVVSFCHTTTCSLCEDIVIIIITLFQEDKIFGMNASLTYGPQIQKRTCVW